LSDLLSSSSVMVSESFEQLTGLVYQILLHVTGFTNCAYISLCVLDLFAYVSIDLLGYMCMHVALLSL